MNNSTPDPRGSRAGRTGSIRFGMYFGCKGATRSDRGPRRGGGSGEGTRDGPGNPARSIGGTPGRTPGAGIPGDRTPGGRSAYSPSGGVSTKS